MHFTEWQYYLFNLLCSCPKIDKKNQQETEKKMGQKAQEMKTKSRKSRGERDEKIQIQICKARGKLMNLRTTVEWKTQIKSTSKRRTDDRKYQIKCIQLAGETWQESRGKLVKMWKMAAKNKGGRGVCGACGLVGQSHIH